MKKVLVLAAAATMAISAQAQERKLKVLPFGSFNEQTTPDQLDPKNVYYTGKIISFSDWLKKSPDEVEFLNLYPGYKEPSVRVTKNGLDSTQVEKITLFDTRAKMVLNTPPSSIDLKKLLKPDVFAKLVRETKQIKSVHQLIAPDQIMPLVAGSGNMTNFGFCNKKEEGWGDKLLVSDGNYILRPSREKDLSHAQRPDRKWCDNPERSVCVESCVKFTGVLYQTAVSLANSRRADQDRKIDYGVAIESEIRYYVSEAEMGKSVSLSKLTGVDSPVRGVLEQSMFYWNQIMQFGKMLTVFQEDPNNAQNTIVTNLFVVGIKTRTYSENSVISQLLDGSSKALNDSGGGVMAGIPVFTQETAHAIGKIFEH